jgi:hypothetical protein
MQPHHHMERAGVRENGEEEWLCPSCGRQLLLRWPPEYQKLVLEPGDEDAAHTGATAGIQLGPIEDVQPGDAPTGPGSDWRRWLADNGIDWDGPAA